MREAIGSSLLLYIVIIIVGVISAFLISSISYSKAYKVKNRIISIIEKYDGNCFSTNDSSCYNEIESELYNMGYSSNINSTCEEIKNLNLNLNVEGILSVDMVYPTINDSSGHRYCVYKITQCNVVQTGDQTFQCFNSNRSYYYKVISFMHFDVPVIGDFLEFKVSGETKSFFDLPVNIKNN